MRNALRGNRCPIKKAKRPRFESLETRRLFTVIYVDSLSTSGANTGTSWTDAFTDLQSGLATANSGDTIEIGQGTYKPTSSTDATATFQLKNGVTILGGYAGVGQTNPDLCNVASYPTILSGDIGTVGVSSDNSNHVVTGSGVNATAILDGVTITSGNDGTSVGGGSAIFNNSGSPTINNCTISHNLDSAVYNANSSATFTNCTFTSNATPTGGYDGGAMYNFGFTGSLTNCTFTSNTGYNDGGALYNFSVNMSITNCVFASNTAAGEGAAMLNGYATIRLTDSLFYSNKGGQATCITEINSCNVTATNCTFADNQSAVVAHTGSSDTETLTNCIIYANTGATPLPASGVTVSYSDIQGGYAGTGNINTDPLFINPSQNNFRLQNTSPAIDAGNNAAVPSTLVTDLDGNMRIYDYPGINDPGAIVDMGAYEVPNILNLPPILSGQTVTLPNTGYWYTVPDLVIDPGGTLDIGQDTVILPYIIDPNPTPSAVDALLGTGDNGGLWTGTGIISSYAAADPYHASGVGSFDDGNETILRVAWYGDANIDGQINSDDLSLVMLGQSKNGTRWQDGNFNYDAHVNSDDWSLLMYGNAIYNQGPQPSAAPLFSAATLSSANDLSNVLEQN